MSTNCFNVNKEYNAGILKTFTEYQYLKINNLNMFLPEFGLYSTVVVCKLLCLNMPFMLTKLNNYLLTSFVEVQMGEDLTTCL